MKPLHIGPLEYRIYLMSILTFYGSLTACTQASTLNNMIVCPCRLRAEFVWFSEHNVIVSVNISNRFICDRVAVFLHRDKKQLLKVII